MGARKHITTAEYVLTTPRERLDKGELRSLERHEAFVEEMPVLAQRLDALAGTRVTLKAERTCFNDSSFGLGTEFTVIVHFAGALLCTRAETGSGEQVVYSLKAEWIEVVRKVANG